MQTENFPISIKNCRDIFPSIWEDVIYEGLYVGENSEIPNVNGMRTDVVEALKQIRIPVLRCRVDVSLTNITGKTASDRKKEERKSSTPTGAAW